MRSLHIYTAPGQPMTRYEDTPSQKWHFGPHGSDPGPWVRWSNQPYMRYWCEHKPEEKFHCHNCGRKMRADELNIQIYYDGDHIYCREKEYGRAPWFPFAYERICKGTAWAGPNTGGEG